MCGVAGLLLGQPELRDSALADAAATMGRAQAHRGPDSCGVWTDAEAGIGLSHQRLAIQDVSQAGHQPMVSACGRLVLSYNGEVYNVAELRRDLEDQGAAFRGHSDTEIILAGFSQWGIDVTVKRMVGMFAFAVWDRSSRELTLVRDRIGIKPMFWQMAASRLLFGSEIKSLLAVQDTAPGVSSSGLASYLEGGFIPAPHTIYRGIQKMRPGTLIRVRAGQEPREESYWSLAGMLVAARARSCITDPDEARHLIGSRLGEAVRSRLLSDRPVGALLSGGIDSTLVAAMMQENSSAQIQTYSIGSPQHAYDEAIHARQIAKHLGTNHTELTLNEADCVAVIPQLAQIYDEPLGDSSQIPSVVLSQIASQHVTVALSGDGGDEVFCGYNRYLWNARLAGLRHRVPAFARRMLAACCRNTPPALLGLAGWATGEAGAARRIHKLAAMLGEDDPARRYRAVITQWPGLCANGPGPAAFPEMLPDEMAGLSEEERFQVLDMMSFLPDDILTKVDRASMAHGLEVRVPFLDHRVIEAAFTLDPALKLRHGKTKWILRELLSSRVPEHMYNRPKQGFAIPIEGWLRHQLRDWADDLITGTDWDSDFGLPDAPIKQAWKAHLRGGSDQSDRLWSILMLASWARAPRGAGY